MKHPDTHAYFAGLRADLARQQAAEHQRQQDTNQAWYLTLLLGFAIVLAVVVGLGVRGCEVRPAEAAEITTGIATWYSRQSAMQEQPQYHALTASGEPLDDAALTCALPSRQFGSRWRVTNLRNGRTITVRQNDLGPGRRPQRRGVVIDLTQAGWTALQFDPRYPAMVSLEAL